MLPIQYDNNLLSKKFTKPTKLSKSTKPNKSVNPIWSTLAVALTATLTLGVLGGCNSTNTESSNIQVGSGHGSESSGNPSPYAVGDLTQSELFDKHPYFAKGYDAFQLSQAQVAQVKSLSSDISLDVYFGAWCHDSQREVPRLLKAMSANANVAVALIALDIRKQEPQGRAASHGVKYTPTIIVKRNGKELGRIIERPKADLISDIVALVK
ncbi:hypothetical protein DXX93_04885 [Thalassotalea euphylliae]|uniref:Thioredoxin n=1 Tax=Thalassotalea euphylliae TaxID=1655234 RepID=A0A3E0TPG3_9GAMM|nr:thioredoxin family protein [Thalassotalea euphylliae]REL25962.1 hypothetical protein DXX93_04885 [Thalassotalea euphylliae]